MKILVTGGCGFVGSALVPALLERGHDVTVLDLMLFGDHLEPHEHLRVLKGDLRHATTGAMMRLLKFDAVIHLACIANDPSWALDPALGKSINYDALEPLLKWCGESDVQRFIYASSSSVYGTKPDGMEVTEKLACEPLTDYSKYKWLGEAVVMQSDMTTTVLRPATVCGYSSRVRLDVVVNQMTIDALTTGTITVHSGSLYRAHLHIRDMVRAYVTVLEAPVEKVAGQVFNVGGENLRISELAAKVQAQTGASIQNQHVTNDPRSYTLNSDRMERLLGFRAQYDVDEAIGELIAAYRAGKIPDPMSTQYHNIRRMEELVKSACLTS